MNVSHFPLTPYPDQMERIEQLLSPFPVVRFMNWQQTNYSGDTVRPMIQNWDDLPKPEDDWGYHGGPWEQFRGVPLQVIIDFANKLGVRPWICIPHAASEDLMREIIAFVVSNAKHRPIFEYSNELWNTLFFQHKYATKCGLKKGLADEEWEAASVWQARCTDHIVDLATPYADTVVAGQFFNYDMVAFLLKQCLNQMNALAVAPYIGRKLRGVNNTLEELHLQLVNELQSEIIPLVQKYRALCDQYQIDLYAYEGGLHLVARNDSTPEAFEAEKQLFAEYNRSEFASELTEMLWGGWRAAGGTVACPYSLSTIYENRWTKQMDNSFFGHCELNGREIKLLPKYEALKSSLKPTEESQFVHNFVNLRPAPAYIRDFLQ